jgi:putative ABC transport system permease protein
VGHDSRRGRRYAAKRSGKTGDAARLALAGIAAGAVVALMLTRLINSLLFGVSPSDPITLAGVALLLGLVAMLACYIPARHATRVDPNVALRYE